LNVAFLTPKKELSVFSKHIANTLLSFDAINFIDSKRYDASIYLKVSFPKIFLIL
jgi:hypothetical protein